MVVVATCEFDDPIPYDVVGWVTTFTCYVYHVYRSVANWFDEDGNLVFEKFLEDVSHLHNDIKSKKDK